MSTVRFELVSQTTVSVKEVVIELDCIRWGDVTTAPARAATKRGMRPTDFNSSTTLVGENAGAMCY